MIGFLPPASLGPSAVATARLPKTAENHPSHCRHLSKRESILLQRGAVVHSSFGAWDDVNSLENHMITSKFFDLNCPLNTALRSTCLSMRKTRLFRLRGAADVLHARDHGFPPRAASGRVGVRASGSVRVGTSGSGPGTMHFA